MEHSDVKKQSEPAKNIRKHPNHKFTWEALTTAKVEVKVNFVFVNFFPCFFFFLLMIFFNFLKKQVHLQTTYKKKLNKQVQSLDLTLFPMGTGIT